MATIGLEAVFKAADFQKGLSEYLKGVKQGEDETEKSTSKMGAALTGFKNVGMVAFTAGAAAVGAAVVGMTGLIAASIGPASDLNETMSKVSVVFGESAADILAWGDTSATALGMSKNSALSAVGTYGNLFRSMGLNSDASADMSMSLVQLAGDLASFNNMAPEEVLEKLRAGLTGETEPLKALGVNMSAATIEAKALELGLIKQGDELTAAAKAQASYALIMEQTALAQGDFARTSDGLANQQRIAAAQFEDLKATLGTAFLPLVQEIMSLITENMPAITDLVKKFAASFDAKAVFETFRSFIEGVFGWIANNQAVIVGALGAITAAVAFWAYTTITAAIPAIVAFVTAAAPVIAIIAAIGLAIGVLYAIWTNDFLGIRTALTEFWQNTLQPFVTQAIAWFQEMLPQAIAVLTNFWNNVLLPTIQTLAAYWQTVLLPALTAVWAFMQDSLFPLFVAIGDFLSAVFSVAVTAAAGLWDKVLLPALTAVWAFIQDKVMPMFETIGKYLDKTFGPIIETIASFVGDQLAGAFQTLGGWIESATKFFKDLADSISKMKLPEWLTPGSPTPLEIGIKGISSATKQLASMQLPALQAQLTGMQAASLSARSQALTPAAASVTNTTNVFDFGGNSISSPMDMAMLKAAVLQVITQEI